MNEVEKMYENAGIEPVSFFDCESYNQKVIKGYLFTAEKQLELIKVLAHCKGYTDYEHFGKYFNDYVKTLEFDEALANIVNDNWQDLTEEERKQIKEILE